MSKQRRQEIEDLQCEVEEYDNINPYEGKDELTPQQEERQEWFDESNSSLQEAVSSIEECMDRLDEVQY